MNKYFVYYFVPYEVDDEGTQVFSCMADDAEHAIEQCRNAYPECVILEVERV